VAPPAAAPPAPPPPAAPPEAPRPAPAAAPPAAAEAPSGAAPALARPQRAEEVPDFLDQVADGLVESARLLREAQPGDPMAAHLVRVGAWLRLLEAPEADAGGTTGVRPLPFSVQGELDDARAAGQWTQVARLAESAVAAYPFAFDLHRQALEAFGEMGARGAKEVVAGSLAALLARLPRLRTLRAVDGTPLLPDETRAALAREGFGAGDGAPAVPGDGAQQGLLEEAARLASGGEVPQAMAQLQAALAGARDARARFRLRLAMADLCRTSGRLPTARALYEILDRDGGAPEPGAPAPVAPWPGPWLDEWDQELASAFLSGYLLCLRALREAGQEIDARREAYVYQRLCRVDSSAALRLE
jgi:type VI secretion system ImpA/VasJ family protein